MKKQATLILFVSAAAAQLAVPGWMIASHEIGLRSGRAFKFRTAPVDPYDAFRGRYVALRFEQNSAPANDPNVRPGTTAYATVEEGPDGFARLTSVSAKRPAGTNYIRCRAGYASGGRVRVELPFDRYYMDEQLAPEAERAYREHSRLAARDAYVTVRVKSGRAVLEELYVGGLPIREFLKTLPPPKAKGTPPNLPGPFDH